ncbi:MAG TPA: YciI family protein [Clostridia bacterium]|nr:YciI family protein [Clostridia bacterium]
MYALAILRYRRPLEEVLKLVDEHRAYLRELKEQGILIASGPLDPRSGGALLLRISEADAQPALDRVRDNDPYTRNGLAQYEIWPWAANIGLGDLDRI